jgi:hypothetical protein
MKNIDTLMSTEGEEMTPLEKMKRKMSYESQTKTVGRTFPDVDVE